MEPYKRSSNKTNEGGILTKTNAHLFDAGIYDMYGLSAETLLNEIVKTHPTWKYRCIQPDITWSDT